MRRLLLIVAGLASALPASAGPVANCDPATLQGGQYSQCLIEADHASAASLDEAVKAALDSIATRPGVFDSQRARWRASLNESQQLWLRFREAECQNVAPFEGQAATFNVARNRNSIFEAKTICSIRMNDERRADIAARYPKP